jgi:hypothetical protein
LSALSERKISPAEIAPACPVANPNSAQESSKRRKFHQETMDRLRYLAGRGLPEHSMSLLRLLDPAFPIERPLTVDASRVVLVKDGQPRAANCLRLSYQQEFNHDQDHS